MSYTKNTIFYKDFTAANGFEYRLEFMPGDTVDLSSPAEVEFPDNVIFNEITLKGGFADPLPKGLPGANTMKLKLNLGNMTGDWADVKQWILNGQAGTLSGSTFTPEKRGSITAYGGTIDLDDVYIPNVWRLKSDLGESYDYYIFTGYQDNIPEVEREINKKWNDETISLTIMGIEKLIFSSVKFSYWADFVMTSIKTQNSYITKWDDSVLGEIKYYSGYRFSRYDIETSSLFSLFAAIETFSNVYYQIYLRDTSKTLNFNNYIWRPWTFYENDLTTNGNSHGTSLGTTDILFISRAILDGTNVAGMLVDSESENSLFEYDNVWDYLTFETDAFKSKARIQYDGSTGATSNIFLTWYKIFEKYVGFTINDDDIIGEKITIKSGVSDITISEAISHIRDIPDDDIDEIQYKMAGTAFQNTDEHELNWHNHLVMFDSGNTKYNNYYLIPERAFFRMLLYKGPDSNYYKANDYCEYDTGDGHTFTPESSYDGALPSIPNNKKIDAKSTFGIAFKQYIDTRLNKSGLGYVTAKAMANIFSSRYQAIVDDIELKHENACLRHVGDRYDLNLSELSAPFGQEAYLVEVEIDVINSLSKCKFYLKGSYDT